jgi:Protein of unknown function (DUF1161)
MAMNSMSVFLVGWLEREAMCLSCAANYATPGWRASVVRLFDRKMISPTVHSTLVSESEKMKAVALIIAMSFTAAPAWSAVKSCDALKTEIEAKIKAKNVKAFSLEVIAAADLKGQAAIGTCDGGKKKIVYKKT